MSGGVCKIYGAGEGPHANSILFTIYLTPPVEKLEEIALSKPTYAVNHFGTRRKELAVNGIFVNDMYHSANNISQPWWIVDLTEMRTIHQVQIFTRQDCCQERLHDVEIRIGQELASNGDLTSYTLMSTYKGPYDISQGHVICSHLKGVTGRFLGIKKISNDTDHLQLVEVRIYAVKKI
ncbi:pentraxin fusion protein-like [Palaemon carinicauda]|uniref:pentraxin fusion protein-like n=1 Tax=Palaemon carinicauda TaxID=392227 RepID=UPI0035B68B72